MNNTSIAEESGLRIDGVRKAYGENVVLNDLTIDVERGKLVSLLGPSGCGKTTTLNMIAGFDVPDSGRVVLGGKDITAQPPNARDTAIVFQNYALFPHMSVFKNVSYGLRVRKVGKAEIQKRVGKVLDLLDIGALRDRYPAQLSGGQQQRVSLARAIAVHPSLLLLDEPLSNLDTKLRQDIRVEIRRLQQELDQTAVFVTHDQEEALVMSDYIAVLNKGSLEQYGSPHDLWESPRTVYVADFMGVENILDLSGRTLDSDFLERGRPFCEDSQKQGYSSLGFRPSHGRLWRGEIDSIDGELIIGVRVVGKAYMGTHVRYSCVDRDGGKVEVDQHNEDPQFDAGEDGYVAVRRSGLLPLLSSSSGHDHQDKGNRTGTSEGTA